MDSKAIGELPLHDAIIDRFVVHWAERYVIGYFLAYREPERSAEPLRVTWHGIHEFHLPRQAPWGESQRVNSATQLGFDDNFAKFQLEMQSGDVVSITASHFSTEWAGAT